MTLFEQAYSGYCYSVSVETDILLRDLFPTVDRFGEYRAIDAWLLDNKRKWPKSKYRKFLLSWFKRTYNAQARSVEREARRDAIVRRELNVGSGQR